MVDRPSPETALSLLKAGHQRFLDGTPLHPHMDVDHLHALAEQQHPIAAVLGCADSRVPVELLFDTGFGDLFVARNAGNVALAGMVGTLEYAVEVLKVPLIVVLGHERCGAVAAEPYVPRILICCHIASPSLWVRSDWNCWRLGLIATLTKPAGTMRSGGPSASPVPACY